MRSDFRLMLMLCRMCIDVVAIVILSSWDMATKLILRVVTLFVMRISNHSFSMLFHHGLPIIIRTYHQPCRLPLNIPNTSVPS